jgi:hypothetical protein
MRDRKLGRAARPMPLQRRVPASKRRLNRRAVARSIFVATRALPEPDRKLGPVSGNGATLVCRAELPPIRITLTVHDHATDGFAALPQPLAHPRLLPRRLPSCKTGRLFPHRAIDRTGDCDTMSTHDPWVAQAWFGTP